MRLIVWLSVVAERFRQAFMRTHLMEAGGRLQRANGVTHLIVEEIVDRSGWLGSLQAHSRDFH